MFRLYVVYIEHERVTGSDVNNVNLKTSFNHMWSVISMCIYLLRDRIEWQVVTMMPCPRLFCNRMWLMIMRKLLCYEMVLFSSYFTTILQPYLIDDNGGIRML